MTIRPSTYIIIHTMGKRGRPTKTRETDLGIYIQKLRDQVGWSVRQLADTAGVSYKTLSKLELGRITPRRPRILQKIAKALDVHPDRLLILAPLTPMLRPPTDEEPLLSKRESLTLDVDYEERRQLENYLQFLRYKTTIENLCKKIEKEILD